MVDERDRSVLAVTQTTVEQNEGARSQLARAFRVPSFVSRPAYIALVAAAIWLFEPSFYHSANVTNVLRQAGILGVVTLGQTLVLLVAGIDLSVGAVMSGTLIAVAALSRPGHLPLVVVVVIVLALGVVVGCVNGLLVAYRKVPPFVATLGMTAVVAGGQLAYTKGVPAGTIPAHLRPLGLGAWGIVPYAALLWLALTGLAFILLRVTIYGRQLYAVGTAAEVASRAGARVRLITWSAYLGCSVLAAAAGIVLSAYVGYVDPGVGSGYDLDSISAAVVGGVAFSGGRGGVIGAALGVLLLTVLLNLVILAGVDPNVQLIVRGGVVIAAMATLAVRSARTPSERKL